MQEFCVHRNRNRKQYNQRGKCQNMLAAMVAFNAIYSSTINVSLLYNVSWYVSFIAFLTKCHTETEYRVS